MCKQSAGLAVIMRKLRPSLEIQVVVPKLFASWSGIGVDGELNACKDLQCFKKGTMGATGIEPMTSTVSR